jgi:hypothetical protein
MSRYIISLCLSLTVILTLLLTLSTNAFVLVFGVLGARKIIDLVDDYVTFCMQITESED